MYTVFTSKKKIIFSYKVPSGWGRGYYKERMLNTAEDVFFYEKNEFTSEGKSMEEIYGMISEGYAFFPINDGTKARDIKDYIRMGFKVAFLRAGEFRKFRKDYKDFV